MSKARDEMLDLIDRKVFGPILVASPDDYGEGDRKKLEELQEKTRNTRHSYRSKYGSADAVYTNFRRDLHSEPAEKVHKMSRELDLPTLNDIEDEVEQLAAKHDVKH